MSPAPAHLALLALCGACGAPRVVRPHDSPPAAPPVRSGLWSGASGYDGCAHSCAVRDGSVWCWGCNSHGQVDGGDATRLVPVRVAGLHRIAAVSLGSQHTCALDGDGAVSCWGRDGSRTPSPVRGLPPVVEVAAGRNATCARTFEGEVFCWGDSFHGERGPDEGDEDDLPSRIPGLPKIMQLTYGFQHVCAVDDGARALCWGNDDWGGVGRAARDAPDEWRAVVVDVAGPTRWIDAGYRHTSAVAADGVVRSWGGVGSVGGAVVVAGIPPMTRVESGEESACGLARDGSVSCWRLDDGRPTASMPVSLPAAAVDLAVSAGHACARVAQDVLCWGVNRDGQLGDGTTRDSTTPVRVQFP